MRSNVVFVMEINMERGSVCQYQYQYQYHIEINHIVVNMSSFNVSVYCVRSNFQQFQFQSSEDT